MLKLLTCSRGHFWESDDDATHCPECGGGAEAMPEFDFAPQAQPASPPLPKPPVEVAGRPVVVGYDILEELGRGPTGFRLYRAKQHLTQREVVLEVVLSREDASQRSWSSLRSEAGLLGKLRHPNIRAVLEAGERDRQLFYNAVELLDGPTLDKLIGDKPPPVDQALRLVELLALAVEHAHGRDVLHRHLEPAKVLLPSAPLGGAACRLHSRSYLPVIVGFGMPRRPVEGDAADAELFADAGYLSPEQSYGRAKDIGQATDVYGLGGVLYFLLTGRAPFRGPTLGDTLDAVQTAKLIAPSEYRRVSADVAFVCVKALARSPRQRHASAADLAEDLRRVRARRAPVGGSSSVFAQLGRLVRRWPAALVALAVCVVMSFLAFRLGGSAGAPSSSALLRAHAERDAARREAAALRVAVDDIEVQKRFQAYRRKVRRAAQLLAAGQADQARPLLDTCPHDERAVEWHYLWLRAGGVRPVAIRPEGARITALAFRANWDAMLAVALVTTEGKHLGGRLELFRVHATDAVLSWTLDSEPLRGLAVYDLRRVTRAPASAALPRPATAVSWHPHGAMLAVIDTSRSVRVYNSQGEEFPGHHVPPAASAAAEGRIAFRPDGVALGWFSEGDADVSQAPYERPSHPLTRLRGPGVVQAFAYAPNSDVAVARSDGTIRFHEPQSGREVAVIEGLAKPTRRLAFNMNGSRLAAAMEGGGVRLFGKAGGVWLDLIDLPGDGVAGLAFGRAWNALAAAGPREAVVFGRLEE